MCVHLLAFACAPPNLANLFLRKREASTEHTEQHFSRLARARRAPTTFVAAIDGYLVTPAGGAAHALARCE